MRVLVVTQHYWPEPLDCTQICEGLAERGHDVTVLCGQPNYPEGRIYDGYHANEVSREERNGVTIVRSPLHPRGTTVVGRVRNYYSFARQATKVSRTLGEGFDVVLSYQTSPVLMARPAIDYCNRTGAPLLLYCLDIWPECLTAGGIRAGSPVYEHYRRVSRQIYSAADLVAVTSPLFEGYLRDVVGVPLDGVVDLPHFADERFVDAGAAAHPGLDPSRVNVTFAGNVGSAQSVETIVRAAELLAGDPRIVLHVLGSGSDLGRCERLARQLGTTNLTFWGRRPLEEMPSFYAASTAMLVTFASNRLLGYTLPLKLHTYLAAGKPVLGAASGDVRRVVEEAGCGWCVEAEDAAGLADACRRLAALDEAGRAELGANARRYYDAHYTKDRFFGTLEDALEGLRGTQHGSRF